MEKRIGGPWRDKEGNYHASTQQISEIMEMNVIPEPEWAIKFQEYLVNELHIKKIDAMCAIGELHSLMKQYEKSI